MLWIKRNLFLVGFGLIAVALLGYSVFKLWSSMSLNKEVQSKVETTQQALESLMRRNPFPSRTNIAIARTELDRVRKATAAAGEFYAPVPFEPVTNQQAFRLLLDNTIYELQRKAEAAGVALPKKDYAFTFEAQKGSLQFASNSLPALPEQLAEIRALSSILFDAKINKLVNLKRWRVSVDDPPGSMDYHDLSPDSNDLTGVVTHPYEVTFNSFTPCFCGLVCLGDYNRPARDPV